MNTRKILLNLTLLILTISGINGFLIEEGFLNVNRSVLSLILDIALFIVAISSFQNKKQIRQLLLIIISFGILTVISFVLNSKELTLIIYLNGLREFIPYFLFPIIYLNLFQSSQRYNLEKYFNVFIYLFLLLQIPVSIYQYSIYGAGDMVGGTQGSMYSGELTFIVFLATYYLMMQGFDENNILKSFIKKSYLLIFWLPAFIDETKISFILIILFILLLNKLSFANIWKYILVTVALIPILIVFNTIYERTTNLSITQDILNKDFLVDYLTSNDDNYTDIPRFQKIIIYMHDFDQKEILFGKGIGQFKGGSELAPTPFADRYDWLLQGSVPVFFFVLVQLGIVGYIPFTLYWITLISFHSNKRSIDNTGNMVAYTTTLFIIIQLYNTSLRSLFFCGIIMYILCYAISTSKKEQSRGFEYIYI